MSLEDKKCTFAGYVEEDDKEEYVEYDYYNHVAVKQAVSLLLRLQRSKSIDSRSISSDDIISIFGEFKK